MRKPANFVSSVSDERGEELSYGGMPGYYVSRLLTYPTGVPISQVCGNNLGIGGVISLLWSALKLVTILRLTL